MNDEFEKSRIGHLIGINSSLHLNNALIGLIPSNSVSAMCKRARLQHSNINDYLRQCLQTENELKQALRELINANESEEIALAQNTSSGISIVARGYLSRMTGSYNVVVLADEYPSNREIWLALSKRYKFELRMIESPLSQDQDFAAWFCNHLDKDTALTSISAVQYDSGLIADLERIGQRCRDNDIFLLVDAIQACGVHPIDVQKLKIDALACGGHKWLMSPEGAGFLFVRRERLESIEPILYGWRSLAYSTTGRPADDTLHNSAQRFESGTQPNTLYAAMNHSVRIILDLGVDNIRLYLNRLREYIINDLADVSAIQPLLANIEQGRHLSNSPILSLQIKGYDVDRIVRRLKRDYKINTINRGGWLRVSPHIYNDLYSVRCFTRALKEILTQTDQP